MRSSVMLICEPAYQQEWYPYFISFLKAQIRNSRFKSRFQVAHEFTELCGANGFAVGYDLTIGPVAEVVTMTFIDQVPQSLQLPASSEPMTCPTENPHSHRHR